MAMAKSLNELRSMSREALVEAHDAASKSTLVGLNYYLEELARRDAQEQGERMERMTHEVRVLTWVIAGLTVVNVILVAVSLA